MNFSQLMGLAGGHVEARIVQTAVELAISTHSKPRILTHQLWRKT